MADPKDSSSFFRKVVKFVSNPSTEWNELVPPPAEVREAEFAKHELKAMIERKRRNDFVRKREFDMLRRVRREGLTGEQLAALGLSSRLDDSEGRASDSRSRPDGVKAKIDEIEQAMTGGPFGDVPARPAQFYAAPTMPTPLAPLDNTDRPGVTSRQAPLMAAPAVVQRAPQAAEAATAARLQSQAAGLSPLAHGMAPEFGDSSRRPLATANPYAVEIIEIAHDPHLDDAVIAFANADFDACEEALSALTVDGGERANHAPTWLALFDLYRATGQQTKFDGLASLYAQTFATSAPQWFSLPKLVAEALGDERRQRPGANEQVGWSSPELLDADAVTALRSRTLQMPLPWIFDWSALRRIDAEGSARLSDLFRAWIPQRIDMRWLQGERLLRVLADAAPNGARDVDPAFWRARLDALRMTNHPDHFDEAAIDYCVTYEVSPPSWEPSACRVSLGAFGASTHAMPSQPPGEPPSSGFIESQILDDAGAQAIANVELSGQLIGDISGLLDGLKAQFELAQSIHVSCTRLIRVDFIAAGDLLNWVLARRAENRSVGFIEAHRLIALFFGAMGINEHAQVRVRAV